MSAGLFVAVGLFIALLSELRRREIVRRKRAEEMVRQAAQDLRRSNTDLEQFACIASHDLQEPLRAVAGFVTLLRNRYQGKLDGEADKFIDFAVDGVSRMSQLIQDLLAYSRVGTHGKQPEPTPCGQSLENALANLQTSISKQNAKITHDPLPVVMADAAQLTQLFQNLIGNAVKFRRDGVPPEIHVGANARATNGSCGSRTTASASRPTSMSGSSRSSSDCMARRNIRARALAWRSAGRSLSVMAEGFGLNRASGKARRSTLRCPMVAEKRHECWSFQDSFSSLTKRRCIGAMSHCGLASPGASPRPELWTGIQGAGGGYPHLAL